MYKKGMVIAVIFLFIAVSFQPVFAIEPSEKVTDSKNVGDEKIEYTIQIIKTNKVIENKVYLTQQQVDNLENLIDEIRADLFDSESQEEINEIYKNAIDSFNNLGLFPEDITINEIRQLVFGETQKLNSIQFKNEISTEFENSKCYIAGETTNTYFVGPASLLLEFLSILSFKLSYKIFIFLDLIYFFSFLSTIWGFIYDILRASIGGIVTIGEWVVDEVNDYYYPAEGWIYTNGINGKKNWTGSFYGQISTRPGFWMTTLYTGIVGFTGIRIYKGDDIDYYQGYALKVHVGTEHP